MKNLKILLFSFLLLFSIVLSNEAEEEEQRYLEKDGNIYKINSSSLHLTPSEEDQKVSKASEELESPTKLSDEKVTKEEQIEPKCACDMTISMGTFSALGSGADEYDPGSSLSITFPTKYNFNLFGKNFNILAEVNLSHLVGIIDGNDKNIKSGIAHFNTDFNLPIDISIGLGIAHLDVDNKGGIGGTGIIDIYYNLPIDNHNISVGFRYQKFVDILTEDPYLDFGFLDTYSLNFNYSKVFSF